MTTPAEDRVTLVPAQEADDTDELEELRRGLAQRPLRIPSKHFYDARGSELFEQICELPEYYQTRTERALLEEHAGRIVAESGARELVEIGAGAATKTRLLLSAMAAYGGADLYVPLDVDEAMLQRVGEELTREYDELYVHAIGGDFASSLEELPQGDTRLFVFLGGTIGNLHPDTEAPAFLRGVASSMAARDHLLLGFDLIKDPAVLEAAYNDTAGVTAAFNRNILAVVNRKAGGDFDPEAFDHRAFYDAEAGWIEMRLRSRHAQRVRIEAMDLELELAAGEEIRTEISAKYDRERVAGVLEQAGLELVDWLEDDRSLFALALARREHRQGEPS